MDDETPTDADILEEALAHAYAARALIGPVLLRLRERERIRQAMRENRAQKKGDPSPAQERIA